MIEIISYQDRWPVEFDAIKDSILRGVSDRVIEVDHIGSTSVPGLAAKDVIDIQITVESLDVLIEEDLNKIGFESTNIKNDHCPAGMDLAAGELQKRFYRATKPKINLHVRKINTFNQKYPILFRDYLRNNSLAREAYGEVKKQLACRFADDVTAYYDIKDPVCDLIFINALEWSKHG